MLYALIALMVAWAGNFIVGKFALRGSLPAPERGADVIAGRDRPIWVEQRKSIARDRARMRSARHLRAGAEPGVLRLVRDQRGHSAIISADRLSCC
jgi:hypothetical protein